MTLPEGWRARRHTDKSLEVLRLDSDEIRDDLAKTQAQIGERICEVVRVERTTFSPTTTIVLGIAIATLVTVAAVLTERKINNRD